MRFAHVNNTDVDQVAQYLPKNYTVFWSGQNAEGIIICGIDDAGWTLDDYVIPRLGSGMLHAVEVWPVFASDTSTGTVNLPLPDTCFKFARDEVEDNMRYGRVW